MENRTKSKQFSMMNFVTRANANGLRSSGSQATSEESNSNSPNGEKSGAERKLKFVWKSKKNSIDGHHQNQTVATTDISKSSSTAKLDQHASSSYLQPTSMIESPTIISDLSSVSQNMSVEETTRSNGSTNQSQNMFDDMDMEDSPAFEFPEVNFSKAKSPSPRKNLSNSRSDSKTPSPSKTRSSLRSSKSQNKERTPDKPRSSKKDGDPLRNLKLDTSISEYLDNIVSHPALHGLEKDGNLSSKNNLDDCKTLYIELLEKISESFERIPQFIKEKLPGFNITTYKKVLDIKKRFKTAINSQVGNKMTSELNKKKVSELNGLNSENLDDANNSSSILNGYNNFDDFDLQSSRPLSPNKRKQTISVDQEINRSETVEKLDLAKKNHSKSSIYSEVPSKKSSVTSHSNPESIDGRTSKVDLKEFAFENSSKAKGKFVFKTPSRLSVDGPAGKSTPIKDVQSMTFERLKNNTDKLKPIPDPEPPKNVILNNSSVNFQPPEFSRSSLLGYNKPCTIVSPIVNQPPIDDEDYDMDCEDVPLDLDDYLDDQNPEASKVSVINISDSLPSTSVDRSKLDQDVIVDNDGWPEYRIEDFEEDFGTQDVGQHKGEGPEVVNLMEQSFRGNQTRTKYAGMGDFHAGTKNDGVTGEFDGFHYPHSSLMMEMFSEKFGLKSFRPNQLQVINATLLGHDCFVLMPTGGGKSLCYQLPAVLTPGVTIVISPLKSLILDQVNKLLSLDIPAAHLSGDISLAECDEIYHKLSTREPYYKLLYVTPEKICSSAKFQSMLDALYSRDKIARFVIDEAHCVSQWGHDFRPDYKKLQILRERFPKTTMMALTATANPRVRMDILHQLKVQACKWFLCSFNRPNLTYRILEKKPKSVNEDVAKIIKNDHFRESGIVYCLSRKECETLATDLKKVGISAEAYHAGLSDKKRESVQIGWVADRYKVICATIAFGMGVDKADVRFVIHHSMPKSVEGYYQETGRAGRDGERSVCALFYSYCDVIRYRKLLDMERNASAEAKRVHVENLLRMVEVCESVSECRRAQVLSYLGERYNRDECKGTCDNCGRQNEYKPVDVTEECKLIVRCIKDANVGGRAAYTLIHIADALRGSVTQRIQNLKNHPMHGKCKSWQRSDPLRLLRQMVVRGLLAEKLVVSNDIANAYIILGPNVDKLMGDSLRVVFPMKVEKRKPALATTSAVTPKEDTTITAEIKRLEERCYADLVEACREMANQRGTSLAAVMPLAALKAMSVRLPERAEDMLAIPHVTRANYDKYGAGLLGITSQYSTEKLCLLMQHEDQMEAEAETEAPGDEFRSEGRDSDTDWGSLARGADASSGGSSQRGRRGYRKGGVRKKFRRAGSKTKAATAAKARVLGFGAGRGGRGGRAARGGARGGAAAPRASSPAKWKSTAGGNVLGSMPVPRANNLVLNTRPGVFNPSKLNLI